MIKYLSIPAVLASTLLASIAVYAQSAKAPCASFQKLPDGKWSVLRPVKIENGNANATLYPGTTISPGTRVTGVDIYAALQQSCH
jgi:ABC-type transport system substrate-binding protein